MALEFAFATYLLLLTIPLFIQREEAWENPSFLNLFAVGKSVVFKVTPCVLFVTYLGCFLNHIVDGTGSL